MIHPPKTPYERGAEDVAPRGGRVRERESFGYLVVTYLINVNQLFKNPTTTERSAVIRFPPRRLLAHSFLETLFK